MVSLTGILIFFLSNFVKKNKKNGENIVKNKFNLAVSKTTILLMNIPVNEIKKKSTENGI